MKRRPARDSILNYFQDVCVSDGGIDQVDIDSSSRRLKGVAPRDRPRDGEEGAVEARFMPTATHDFVLPLVVSGT